MKMYAKGRIRSWSMHALDAETFGKIKATNPNYRAIPLYYNQDNPDSVWPLPREGWKVVKVDEHAPG